jgi:hypothetical protein
MTSQPDPAGATQPLGATQPVGPDHPGAATAGASTPQDAPLGQPWPPAAQQPSQLDQPGPATGMPAPPLPAPAPAKVARRVYPAPTGTNWILVVVALLLVLASAAEIAYLLGYRPDGNVQIGPGVLIGAGGLLVLVGVVGLLGQRRSR